MAFAIAAIAGGLVGACGETEGTDPGSGGHFLESCDAACGDGLACLSGVCTTTCGRDADCTPLAPAATCIDSASSSTRGTCDVRCKSDADCSSLDAAEQCASGRCRAMATGGLHPGAGGAGGSAPSTGGVGTAGEPEAVGGVEAGGAPESTGGIGTAGAPEAVGGVGTAGASESGGSAGTAGTTSSGGSAGTGGATAGGGTAGTGSTPVSDVYCTYTRTVGCNADCGGLPAPLTIAAEHVPVSRVGGGAQPSMETAIGDVTAGVLLDAPAIFGAWIIGSVASSYGVIDIATKDVALPPGPRPDWWGHYGPAPVATGSGSGLITIKDGQANININMGSTPNNGAFACNLMVTGNHGCVSQSIQCGGTAFIPEFDK